MLEIINRILGKKFVEEKKKDLTFQEVQILHDIYGFEAVVNDGKLVALEREV